MTKMVFVSGVAQTLDRDACHRHLWHATRDMDFICRIEELPRTGDARKFVVTGTRA